MEFLIILLEAATGSVQNSQEITCARDSFLIKLQAKAYEVNLRIQSKYRKIRTRKNSAFGHFSCGEHLEQGRFLRGK